MSGYALLSEVYGDLKPKKRGKKKNSPEAVQDHRYNSSIKPLSPQEMEKELLQGSNNSGVTPHDSSSSYYRSTPQTHYSQPRDVIMQNAHIVDDSDYEQQLQNLRRHKPEPGNQSGVPSAMAQQDPEYLEFLEFKKQKAQNAHKERQNKQRELTKALESHDMMSSNDQFNELLLYIFTGLFLLCLYDNIYKLGRDSSFY